jgi:hypothetical protein
MALTRDEVFQISRQSVIDSVTRFIRNRARNSPNFQILDLIIPTERRIRSVVGGMETSLGTTLWEPLAKNLSSRNGFEVIHDNLQAPLNMPASLQNTLQILNEGRLGLNSRMYSAQYCHDRIKEVCSSFIQQPITEFTAAPRGFGVDIWLRKEGINYFFDTKTVQANVGTYSKCFGQILNWYAYFYSRYPEGLSSARIVFPYNPYENADFWSATIGNGWPLEPHNEGWVENEFWDFCTGLTNTYEIIYNSFVSISDSGDLEEIIRNIFYGNRD